MNPATLATWFFIFQRAFQTLVDGVFHDTGAFGANPKLTELVRQRKATPPGCTVMTVAIDLYKPANKLDIFFLMLR